MRPAARVTLLPDATTGPVRTDGPVDSAQEAEIEFASDLLPETWEPHHMERLARSYWRFLTRASLRLIRVVYAPDSRTVVLLTRRIPLLRFRAPEFRTGPRFGQVTWRIERGLLVARRGRGSGFLRITVRAPDPGERGSVTRLRVRAEVANYYPLLRGSGWFARLGARIYNATQLRIHVWVTRGFLRSLVRLELQPEADGQARALDS